MRVVARELLVHEGALGDGGVLLHVVVFRVLQAALVRGGGRLGGGAPARNGGRSWLLLTM